MRNININDVDDFLHPPPPPPPPQAAQPADPAKMAAIAQKEKSEQRKAANELMQSQNEAKQDQTESSIKAAELASKERIATMENQTEQMRLSLEDRQQHEVRKQNMLHKLLDHASNGVANHQTFGGTEF